MVNMPTWVRLLLHILFLQPLDNSTFWSTLLVWVARILTFSFLFRTYLGPAILRIASSRLRVRSISFRSVRGVYFRARGAVWRVDRIGISYQRRSSQQASRFSLKVEGLSIEVGGPSNRTPTSPRTPGSKKPRRSMSSLLPRAVWRIIWNLLSYLYSYVEPSVRPMTRSFFVSMIRAAIRLLPVITHILEFELDSAVISHAAIPGASLSIGQATVRTSVSFTYLENAVSANDAKGQQTVRHRRFSSVVDWNARVKDSMRRTWDRAWGATQIAASISLRITHIKGHSGSTGRGYLAPGRRRFLDVPTVACNVGARFNPHRGLEKRSIDVSLDLGNITVDLDVIRNALNKLKEQSPPSSEPVARVSPVTPLPPSGHSYFSSREGWRSPLSPASPFINMMSAPTKWKWAAKHTRTISRIPARQNYVSYVKSLQVKVARFTGSFGNNAATADTDSYYKGSLHHVLLGVSVSQPSPGSLHKRWLGSSVASGERITHDSYAIQFGVGSVSVNLHEVGEVADHLQVLSVNTVRWDSLLVQWPWPWLQGTRFLSGDPNAQFIATSISVGTVQLTERLELLEHLLSRQKSTQPTVRGQSLLPSILSPVPRIAFDLEVGSVVLRLISPTRSGDQGPFALEARTEGIAAHLDSSFTSRPDNRFGPIKRDYPGLLMQFNYGANLERSFIKLSFGVNAASRDSDSDSGLGTHPTTETVLSLDVVQLKGSGDGMGEFADELHGVVSLDMPSVATEVQCVTDAISVELWQPDVIQALSFISSKLAGTPRPPISKSPRRILDQLPFGVVGSCAVGRLVLFMTAPDLAPDEALNISRGVACRSGLSLTYCALNERHSRLIPSPSSRHLPRTELSLPADPITHCVTSSGSNTKFEEPSVFIQVMLWDVALRDAIATRFAADDPYGLDDDNPDTRTMEFLRISSVDTRITITGQRVNGEPLPKHLDKCDIHASIPRIKGNLHLAHVYNILLALSTVRAVAPPSHGARPKTRTPPTIRFDTHCIIGNLGLRWTFPLSTKAFLRASSMSFRLAPDRGLSAGWDSVQLAVAVAATRDGANVDEWRELIRLPRWNVELVPNTVPATINVKGDSARIRIPFDFVLADLILDVNLTVKSAKHLVRMVAAGVFQNPPPPEEEDAKRVPRINLDLGRLTVEAADEPLETRLNLIWRVGFEAARVRQEREDAFSSKVATILTPQSPSATSSKRPETDYQFTSKHTVSIADARNRLSQVHSVAWKTAHQQAKRRQVQREESYLNREPGSLFLSDEDLHDFVSSDAPPLFRITFDQLVLTITPPKFSYDAIPDILHDDGKGMPRDTRYSLLVPLHIHFSVASARMSFREYPMPLVNIPHPSNSPIALEFDSGLIVAEEMATGKSVDWIPCEIVKAHTGVHGASPLSIHVPKTIMPVKTYAEPTVRVMTDKVTDIGWGLSYSPATQDFMRVLDTLSHSPKDSSPAIGFWDKLRLILHWRAKILFSNEVRFHMKGSRDPHELQGHGAGVALCWKGNPQILVGQPNDAGELIQVVSETMLVVIPSIDESYGDEKSSAAPSTSRPQTANPRVVCAKLRSGTCFGVGFVLERSCGPECMEGCVGPAFDRKCRLFDFKPHYDVKLELKDTVPLAKSPEDSYNGFRSDFVHMSISLTSGRNSKGRHQSSNIHLSPEVFSHFWSWWSLFDGTLSMPIRQGKLYSRKRPLSPKFGKHLGTIKYRISIPQLYISHVYVDNSQDAWMDGVTPFIGVKAMVDHFQADMHQRDQITSRTTHGSLQTVHHKAFCAIEVVMKGLDLRALLAVFPEPLKQCIPVENTPFVSNYRTRNELEPMEEYSEWVDMDDFAGDDAANRPSTTPEVFLLPAVSCPRFTYFKRLTEEHREHPGESQASKFGNEDTHLCLLGKEDSVSQIQIGLASDRINELRRKATRQDTGVSVNGGYSMDELPKMIALLEGYINQLQQVDAASHAKGGREGSSSYYMPADIVSPEEWAGFLNVYQVHSPQIIMDNAIRDLLMQYYYCSRSRRGFEYHMATRAVKFIRDQALAAINDLQREPDKHRQGPAAASAQAAAVVMKRLLGGTHGSTPSVEFVAHKESSQDPLHGWGEGVSPRKSHFCLLLKPQVVLRHEGDKDAVCVLAAVQGKLKSFAIMDDANAHDPVSGKVMNRNFAWLTGLQTFSPSATNTSGEHCVPLEVLIDLRCENKAFDRLVPQTDATFQYDKFNRLRLRNTTNAVAKTGQRSQQHLQNQTDLVRLHVPRFTISANDRHFDAISNIVTKLVLFTDAAHKTRSEKLERLLFSYDFTNYISSADVVSNMQSRLRSALETKQNAEPKLRQLGNSGQVELLKIDAHILLLVEELNLIFDAIKIAQDKANDQSDQKSALLLHASSAEVSWRMLDQHDQLLAKLAVRDTDFYWLSRHDSSTTNTLRVGDLQAFDGAADAEWTEILSKHDEPANHPLVKQKLFLLAEWTVLPPVGGITIYQSFEIMFHPMRLQIDIRVGRKIMEYMWPARRDRQEAPTDTQTLFDVPDELPSPDDAVPEVVYVDSPRHASFDVARRSIDNSRLAPPPALRRLGTSRSFTDLRNARRQDSMLAPAPRLTRMHSSDALRTRGTDAPGTIKATPSMGTKPLPSQETDDAAEMKTRSSQKTFVKVKVASLHLVLSIAKEDSFLCRDARIRTRDLEYRNQTWSFEELVGQFIPSGRNWRGWVKVAFQQPLLPVLPVARELISKTKWIASKKDDRSNTRPIAPKTVSSRSVSTQSTISSTESSARSTPAPQAVPVVPVAAAAASMPRLSGEGENATIVPKRSGGVRPRMMSLFKRRQTGRDSQESDTPSLPDTNGRERSPWEYPENGRNSG